MSTFNYSYVSIGAKYKHIIIVYYICLHYYMFTYKNIIIAILNY